MNSFKSTKMEIKTVAELYKLYLQRVKLDEAKMHPEQKRQLKQVFFGAWGQSLIAMRDISLLEEDDGVEAIEALMAEVGNFFIGETNQHN
jgi:hypothetical protein